MIRKKHAEPSYHKKADLLYSQTGFYCELGIVYDMYACGNTIWSCYERSSRISGSIIARNLQDILLKAGVEGKLYDYMIS